jgi:hypothetical protein
MQKRAGGMTQVVKCLPSKHAADSSNPSTAKKKKRKEQEKQRKNKISGFYALLSECFSPTPQCLRLSVY